MANKEFVRQRRSCLGCFYRGMLALIVPPTVIETVVAYDLGERVELKSEKSFEELDKEWVMRNSIRHQYGIDLSFGGASPDEKQTGISGNEVEDQRTVKATEEIFNLIHRYPPEFINRCGTREIRVMDELQYSGQMVGGLSVGKKIFLHRPNDVMTKSVNIAFDHEVCHQFEYSLDEETRRELLQNIKNNNPTGFVYEDEKSPITSETKLEEVPDQYKDSFVTSHEMKNVTEDLAGAMDYAMGSRLFLYERPWNKKRFMKKVESVKQTISRLVPRMDAQYWRDLRKPWIDWQKYWG